MELRKSLAGALLFLAAPLIAQTQAAYTIEARPDAFALSIPVKVNGAGPFWCLLDTGANNNFNINTEPAKKAGLRPNAEGSSAGVGPNVIPDRRVLGVTLGVGQLNIPNRTVIIRDAEPGATTDCAIGTEILAGFVVEIDYQTPAVKLYKPKSFKPRAGAVAVPVTFDLGNPLIHAHILLRPGEEVDAK